MGQRGNGVRGADLLADLTLQGRLGCLVDVDEGISRVYPRAGLPPFRV